MTDEDIDKAEFDERVAEIENDEPEPVPEDGPELLSFSDLLDLREDLTAIGDQLDSSAGYWAQVTLVLEEQAEMASGTGNAEKADAIEDTAEKARELAERIDGGATLLELEQEVGYE